MLRTGAAILARPSPTRDAGWWPRRPGVPTGLIFPRTTSGLTWSRAPAPVRRGMSPEPCCQRGSGTATWIGPIVSSDSMRRFVERARCGPSALRRDRAQAGRCDCTPQETLLQQAHALQQSEAFTEYRRRRVVVEHRLARLVQLGIHQSRYFGRAKTLFQLYLAATVANLTLVAAKVGMTGETGSGPSSGSVLVTRTVNSAAITGTAWLWQIWTLTLLPSALLPHYPFATRGFRPSF